jgi:hypothetical protein
MTERPRSLADARYGAIRSRRLLVTTIKALGDHASALTVIGAHAVHVWVQDKWGPIDMESTRDGDVVLDPVFVATSPKIVEMMADAGVVPVDQQSHPGIYGYQDELDHDWHERTTVDLIVPETYAGKGSRSATIGGQDRAALRARGLELAIYDRRVMSLSTMDDDYVETVEVNVAGPAALLIAKAHKVVERASDERRPHRLRPKDSGDIALLMMVSNPTEIAKTMHLYAVQHREIAEVVSDGADALISLYAPESDSLPRDHMASSLGSRFAESEVYEAVDVWMADFETAWRLHAS